MGGGKLKNAINSIINQTIDFKNIELIIVDDASTKISTKKTLLKYQSRYPENIKLIFMGQNSGYPGKPRNIGLKQATSDYIIFLDDDDIYFKDAIKILYDKITKFNSNIVIGNGYINIDGSKSLIMKKQENIININPLENQDNFDIICSIDVASWGRIYEKKLILDNNIQFLENSNYEDYHFYFKTIKYANKISVFFNEILYIYNIHNDSSIHTKNIGLFNNLINGMYSVNNLLKDIPYDVNNALKLFKSILIVFCSLQDNEKRKAILKIYKLEKYLEKEIKFNGDLKKVEMNILNNAIMQKKFRKAIFISNIYKKLHENQYIKKFYYKLKLKISIL